MKFSLLVILISLLASSPTMACIHAYDSAYVSAVEELNKESSRNKPFYITRKVLNVKENMDEGQNMATQAFAVLYAVSGLPMLLAYDMLVTGQTYAFNKLTGVEKEKLEQNKPLDLWLSRALLEPVDSPTFKIPHSVLVGKYPELSKLSNSHSQAVFKELKSIMCRRDGEYLYSNSEIERYKLIVGDDDRGKDFIEYAQQQYSRYLTDEGLRVMSKLVEIHGPNKEITMDMVLKEYKDTSKPLFERKLGAVQVKRFSAVESYIPDLIRKNTEQYAGK